MARETRGCPVIASHGKGMGDPVARLTRTETVLPIPVAHNARNEQRPDLDMSCRGTYSCAIGRQSDIDRDLRTVALSTKKLLAATRV